MLSKLLGIRIFDLEASGACNLNCPFCPRELLPPVGNMSPKTFEAFLNGLTLRGTDALSFVGIGEPLLNPHLPAFIRSARERCAGIQTSVTTNGTLLDERHVPGLLESGVGTLDVSFNGLEKSAYEKLMKGACFENVIDNLSYTAAQIKQRRSRTRLQINFIVNANEEKEETRIKEFWRARGIRHFRVNRMHDRAGTVHMDGLSAADVPGLRQASCAIFDTITFVTWQGDVMYCCHDIPRKHKLGNVQEDDWGTLQARKQKITKLGCWPSMCDACTDPLRHDMHRKIDECFLDEARIKIREGLRLTARKARGLVSSSDGN